MELALYCPELGFYDRFPHRIGTAGDFYTSVTVGPAFGALLAFQSARWLENIPDHGGQLVEAGAHDGQLALDILGWLRRHESQLFSSIAYWILESSPARQRWQQTKLGELAEKVRWLPSVASLPAGGVRGVILSNEFLDALPVHRCGWDAGTRSWFEWGVGLEEGRFTWVRLPLTAAIAGLLVLPPALQEILPDGFVFDVSPQAVAWWRKAASALACGYLLTLDYGYTRAERLGSGQSLDTLRAYHRHRLSEEVLARPGEQDLTAHVDFSALAEAGEALGLQTESHVAQGRFLTGVYEMALTRHPTAIEWSAAERRQFLTLTHPEHLGTRFRALVQRRGTG
jgi:SAM-dependent MidA family methyltransferase